MEPADGSQRSPLAVVGVAGAIIAAGLALTMVAPALRDDLGGGVAAPATSTTAGADSSAPAPTAARTRPRPTTAEGVIAEVDRILSDAAATGGLDGDVVRDLRKELDGLQERLADGKRVDFAKRADELLQKIRERLREGEIPAQTAASLRALLQPYADRTGNGDDEG